MQDFLIIAYLLCLSAVLFFLLRSLGAQSGGKAEHPHPSVLQESDNPDVRDGWRDEDVKISRDEILASLSKTLSDLRLRGDPNRVPIDMVSEKAQSGADYENVVSLKSHRASPAKMES